MAPIITLLIIAAVLALGVALAYVPMRLLLAHMARNVRQFLERQRERRTSPRRSPDRRKVSSVAP
jgi:hypothetical protein